MLVNSKIIYQNELFRLESVKSDRHPQDSPDPIQEQKFLLVWMRGINILSCYISYDNYMFIVVSYCLGEILEFER